MSRTESKAKNSSNAFLVGIAVAVVLVFVLLLAIVFFGLVAWLGTSEVTSGSGPVEPLPTMHTQ